MDELSPAETLAIQLFFTWQVTVGAIDPDGPHDPAEVAALGWIHLDPLLQTAWLGVADKAIELLDGN